MDDPVDFAVAAYRTGGEWAVAELSHHHLDDIDTLAAALRRLPGDGGALALVAVDEDFFLLVRVLGTSTRVLLSDVSAAEEWKLAGTALDLLRLPPTVAGAGSDRAPAGHLDIVADLGLSDVDLDELLHDPDLYPDEVLSDLARHLGFGPQFDDVVGLTSA